MSLYVYSMWVYRAERNPYAVNKSPDAQTKPRYVDMPFDDSYVAGRTWVQRLALEPRIPKVEGFQFVTDVDPEMHFLLKAVLLRPIYLGPAVEDDDTKQVRVLRAFEQLCTAPPGEDPWPALNSGPSNPGPFERGWRQFFGAQQQLMESARQSILRRQQGMWSQPTL